MGLGWPCSMLHAAWCVLEGILIIYTFLEAFIMLCTGKLHHMESCTILWLGRTMLLSILIKIMVSKLYKKYQFNRVSAHNVRFIII